MVHLRGSGAVPPRAVPMTRQSGYRHAVTLPPGDLPAGLVEYHFEVTTTETTLRHPTGAEDVLVARVETAGAPLVLFDATTDIPELVYTRIGDNVRRGIFKAMPASDAGPAALRLMFPLSLDPTLDDYTASLVVKERVRERAANLAGAVALRITLRGRGEEQPFFVTLVEADGTSWSRHLDLPAEWREVVIPLAELSLAQGVKLPLGFPERWNYWLTPASGRGGPGDRLRIEAIERVQISFGRGAERKTEEEDSWADVATIRLEMK
jgi:hypothetical protein